MSVELSRPPSRDDHGDWGMRSGAAHYKDGWFTYAIDTDDPNFFVNHVGDGWHKWMREEMKGAGE